MHPNDLKWVALNLVNLSPWPKWFIFFLQYMFKLIDIADRLFFDFLIIELPSTKNCLNKMKMILEISKLNELFNKINHVKSFSSLCCAFNLIFILVFICRICFTAFASQKYETNQKKKKSGRKENMWRCNLINF